MCMESGDLGIGMAYRFTPLDFYGMIIEKIGLRKFKWMLEKI